MHLYVAVYEDEIAELNNKISSLEDSISTKEDEIKKLEKETEEKQDLLIQRLVAMYETGQTTYLDVLLSSEDMTSLISNYYRIEEIAEADQAVIDSIIAKQEETEEAKQELEKEKKEIDTSKKEVEQKSQSLQTAKQSKQTKVNSLSAEEKELQSKIDEFEEAIKDARAEIVAAAEEAQNSGSGYEGTFKGMFEWPVSYSYNIRSINKSWSGRYWCKLCTSLCTCRWQGNNCKSSFRIWKLYYDRSWKWILYRIRTFIWI